MRSKPNSGRSPLTRGRRNERAKADLNERSIPAHAGETGYQGFLHRVVGVDPRSRGGDSTNHILNGVSRGRSPLTRGRLPNNHLASPSGGSIPAHAGETL